MTVAELLNGGQTSKHAERNRQEVLPFVSEMHVLPFGRRAASMHAELHVRLRAQRIGPNGLVIAATPVTSGATLVTANTGGFARIDELRVEAWR